MAMSLMNIGGKYKIKLTSEGFKSNNMSWSSRIYPRIVSVNSRKYINVSDHLSD